jgi:hypothetical protein
MKKPPRLKSGRLFLLLYSLLLDADLPDQLSLPEWKLNTAPSLMPDGQRAVTVFSLV